MDCAEHQGLQAQRRQGSPGRLEGLEQHPTVDQLLQHRRHQQEAGDLQQAPRCALVRGNLVEAEYEQRQQHQADQRGSSQPAKRRAGDRGPQFGHGPLSQEAHVEPVAQGRRKQDAKPPDLRCQARAGIKDPKKGRIQQPAEHERGANDGRHGQQELADHAQETTNLGHGGRPWPGQCREAHCRAAPGRRARPTHATGTRAGRAPTAASRARRWGRFHSASATVRR